MSSSILIYVAVLEQCGIVGWRREEVGRVVGGQWRVGMAERNDRSVSGVEEWMVSGKEGCQSEG